MIVKAKSNEVTLAQVTEMTDEQAQSIEDAKKQVGELTTKVTQNSEKIESVASDTAGLQTKVTQTADKLETVSGDVDGMNTKLTQTADKLETVSTNVDGLSTTVSQTAEKLETVSGDVDGMNTKLTQTADKLETVSTDVDGMNTKITQNSTSIETLVSDVDGLEGNYSSLSTTVDGFETRVQNAEGAASSAKQTADGFEKRVTILEDDQDGMETRIKNVEDDQDALEMWIRFDSTGLTLGNTGSKYSLKVTNEGINYYYETEDWGDLPFASMNTTIEEVTTDSSGEIEDYQATLWLSAGDPDNSVSSLAIEHTEDGDFIILGAPLIFEDLTTTSQGYHNVRGYAFNSRTPTGGGESLNLASTTWASNVFATKSSIPTESSDITATFSGTNKNIKFSNSETNYYGARSGWCSDTFQKKSSDERIKDDIEDLDESKAVELYEKLKPKKYHFKKELLNKEVDDMFYEEGSRLGLIAQDLDITLKEYIPDHNITPKHEVYGLEKELCPDGMMGIEYNDLHALHIVYARALEKRIAALEERIAQLEEPK